MKKTYIKLLVLLAVITSSCATYQKKHILYSKKENVENTTEELKGYLSKYDKPNIVLKIPLDYSTSDENYNELYSTIERELSMGGFIVKDRILFNQAIRIEPGYSYKEILNKKKYDIMETDLIFEITSLKTDIEYNTNKVIDENGQEEIYKNSNIKRIGGFIKFNIVNIQSNTSLGNYIYFYTPCTDKSNDCRCFVAYKSKSIHPYYKYCPDEIIINYNEVDIDDMKKFLENSIKQFLYEIK